MSRHGSFLLGICLTAAVWAAGCDRSAPANAGGLRGQLTVTGSSTVAPLVAEIAKRFEDRHPGVRVDVQTGGSGQGIADARVGVADIGMASRALKQDEQDLVAHRVAADGVCLIVHATNPITELTPQQIAAIYTGKVTNWREVGGRDATITVVHKAEGRATLEVFLAFLQLENPAVKPDVVVGDNEHGVKTVAGNESAIGYVSIGTAEANVESGTEIRLLPLEGVEASSESVASGAFPIGRPLNLVTQESAGELAMTFVRYCQSEEVHDLVVSQYFVPIHE